MTAKLLARCFSAFIVSLMLALASATLAADRTWTGLGADTRWLTPENWAGNAVPSGSADVAIFAAGTTYRLTVDGAQSDVQTSSGALALSGLTVGAATANEPAETTYVIVHAGGGITGEKPVLSGFPSKHKLIRNGNDLLLTSQGGAHPCGEVDKRVWGLMFLGMACALHAVAADRPLVCAPQELKTAYTKGQRVPPAGARPATRPARPNSPRTARTAMPVAVLGRARPG